MDSFNVKEITNEQKSELEKEIINLENKFKDLLNKFEEIKIIKENEIKKKNKRITLDDSSIYSKIFYCFWRIRATAKIQRPPSLGKNKFRN